MSSDTELKASGRLEIEPHASLADEYGFPPTVRVEGFYATDNGAGFVIALDLGTNPDSPNVLKESARTLARRVGNELFQAGAPMPVILLLIVPLNRETEFRLLAADQDWHRGDFVLVVACSAESAHAQIFELLADRVRDVKHFPDVSPLSDTDLRSRLTETVAASILNDRQHQLLRSLVEAWDGEPSFSAAIERWLNESISSATSQQPTASAVDETHDKPSDKPSA